jgi:hypothetical protein
MVESGQRSLPSGFHLVRPGGLEPPNLQIKNLLLHR